ncbi:hypothetical protein BSLG_008087 [Batrachochytrium salamandrivorans]|nr:hypothetical protein BSLG_008087 [Batrachochytrium salamandrivorans]
MAILCRRKQDNSPVVIKELFTQCMTEDEKQTSLNEIKVLTILRHPNIIAYFDSFTAMGIMDAESLSSSGASSGGNGHLGDIDPNMPKQPVRKSSDRKKEIMNLFCQIGLALNHIHSLNILHRDLKTNNILVSGCGRYKVLKIGDFGISKIMSTAASAETVVGTPAYISPELCEGKPYNEKSDIWALGCVLYEMICLKKMFSAHNLPALVLRILRGTYEPIPVHVPSNLAVLVKSCVETEPEKRPFMPDIIGMPFLQDALVQTIFGVGRIDHPRLVQTPLDTALAAPCGTVV